MPPSPSLALHAHRLQFEACRTAAGQRQGSWAARMHPCSSRTHHGHGGDRRGQVGHDHGPAEVLRRMRHDRLEARSIPHMQMPVVRPSNCQALNRSAERRHRGARRSCAPHRYLGAVRELHRKGQELGQSHALGGHSIAGRWANLSSCMGLGNRTPALQQRYLLVYLLPQCNRAPAARKVPKICRWRAHGESDCQEWVEQAAAAVATAWACPSAPLPDKISVRRAWHAALHLTAPVVMVVCPMCLIL